MNATGKVIFLVLLFSPVYAGISTICFANERVEELKSRAQKYYWGRGVPQDYSKALSLYLQAAKSGDPEAQYIAGGMYFKGQGVPADFRTAFQLLYEAAKKGKSTPESEKILAQSFLVGRGIPKNYPEAVRWYSQAAEGGDRDAQNELAFLYFVGQGVEQDFTKSFEFFQKAADNGLAVAQYNIGIMYYTGNGVAEADLEASYAWFNLAAANGYEPAVSARQLLEQNLSPEELALAQKKSQALYDSYRKTSKRRP